MIDDAKHYSQAVREIATPQFGAGSWMGEAAPPFRSQQTKRGITMAKLLIPGLDADADAVFRRAHGLGPDDPAPVSLYSPTWPEDKARNLDIARWDAKERGQYTAGQNPGRRAQIAIPSPGLSQAELDRKLDASADRARLRRRDFFSIPAYDNRAELALKSLPGARNDTKAYIPGSQAFGNFLFGGEAAAAGLSEEEARGWGRFAQGVQDMGKGKRPSGRDNPGDADLISRGYRYYQDRHFPKGKF